MSEINMNKDGFYGSGGAEGATPIGGGGGVGSIWGKLTLLELNQNKILSRLDQLEKGCDAGEPVNKYYTACLSKEQISDKLMFNKQREIEELKTKIADKHKLLLKMMDERDRYKNQMNAKQKVLEDVMDQRDRYLKQIYELSKQLETVKKDNEYSSGTLKNYEDRVAELDKENKDLKQSIGNQRTTITYLQNMNLHRVAKIDELEKANKYWEERVEKLQNENGDLRWGFDHPALVEYQTARECTEIVNRIKNDPLTTMSTSKEWMVAICEDIEKEIKKEFDLK